MDLSKLSGAIQVVLLYGSYISEVTFKYITGQEKNNEKWYILLRYYGDVDALKKKYGFGSRILNDNFAYLYIDKKSIPMLSDEINVIYIELPFVMNYILEENAKTVCLTERVYSPSGFGVSGKGTLIGVIDSGIDYFHDDFRNADGTTRIVSIWDQTDRGSTEESCQCGMEYTRAQINEALKASTKIEGLKSVPVSDLLGHGTAVAGIAAGNGRASGGKYVGVAPDAELVIVKIGTPNISELNISLGGTTAQVMLGIDYIIKKAIEQGKPVSISIGVGLNEGLHDGQSSLEVYMGQAALVWKNNLVVGVGNQANKESHTSGRIKEDEIQSQSIFVDVKQPFYLMTVVYGVEDTMVIEVKAPTGETTGKIESRTPNQVAILGNNSIIINFIQPNNVYYLNQISILIDQYEGIEVASGVWEVILYGEEIVTGTYNIWGSSIDPIKRLTRFLNPDPFRTLTIPSTGLSVTSVGAINGFTKQIANFSGRGYTLNEDVKPDFVASGVNVIAPTSLSENGYATVTGTSAAGAFVTGGYALLYEYGLNKKPKAYLYGEALKAIMIKKATRASQNGPYPNPSWGYGVMCIEETLNNLKELYLDQ